MYKDLEARLHDLFWHAESDLSEFLLLEKFLIEHPGKSIEIGCGSGRLLLPLIEKGFDIEGLEISDEMLLLLKHAASKKELSPKLYHTDVKRFETSQKYDAIAIPAFTLQLFSRQDALNTLIKLRSLASHKGGLYITLFIPWVEIIDQLEQDIWHLDKQVTLANGNIAKCMTRHQINRVFQTIYRDHHYSIHNTSETLIEEQFTDQELQWYHLPELITLLKQSGWNYLNYDADFKDNHQDSDASLITVYASAF